MQLKRVSISGVDDSTTGEELQAIHREFPFVEWGLLIHDGPARPRYPSAEWRHHLLATQGAMSYVAHLEANVCRMILGGTTPPGIELAKYRRVQFNLARELDFFLDLASFSLRHLPKLDTIIQIPRLDSKSLGLAKAVQSQGFDVSILYDGSWGRGILPGEWPSPPAGFETGMAGGLSPDNLEAELAKIAALPGPSVAWIDLETHVRDPISDRLDPERVCSCLAIARGYVVG